MIYVIIQKGRLNDLPVEGMSNSKDNHIGGTHCRTNYLICHRKAKHKPSYANNPILECIVSN